MTYTNEKNSNSMQNCHKKFCKTIAQPKIHFFEPKLREWKKQSIDTGH